MNEYLWLPAIVFNMNRHMWYSLWIKCVDTTLAWSIANRIALNHHSTFAAGEDTCGFVENIHLTVKNIIA